MYNLNKKDIIQDEFGRSLSKFDLFKQEIQNKLATIDFNEIKSNLGPSILSGLKTLGILLVSVLKFIYQILPTIAFMIFIGYVLLQITLFLGNNIAPHVLDNFKGWTEFSNKLPYAFHTDIHGMVKFGRLILFLVLACNITKLSDIVDIDRDNEYPFYSYIVVVLAGLFITCLIIPRWFHILCGLSILIGIIASFIHVPETESGSYSRDYEDDYEEKPRKQETSTYTQPVVQEQKTKQIASANSWAGNSTMVHFTDGSRTAIPGYLHGFTGNTVTVTTDKAGKSFIIYEMKGSTLSRGRSWYQP